MRHKLFVHLFACVIFCLFSTVISSVMMLKEWGNGVLPALRGAMLPAGHSCFHCCGHWPPISHQPSHWPQTGLPRPPIGASGSTGRRRAGTKQTWPWQGPTTNSCTLQTVTRSPSLMRIGCATLVLRIALANEKTPPQKTVLWQTNHCNVACCQPWLDKGPFLRHRLC